MLNLDARRAELEARMLELDHKLHRIEDALDAPKDRDWEERAVELETEEVLEGEGRAGQLEMQMISAALHRIEVGEYGYCAECGAEISKERLNLLPATPFCRRCAQRH